MKGNHKRQVNYCISCGETHHGLKIKCRDCLRIFNKTNKTYRQRALNLANELNITVREKNDCTNWRKINYIEIIAPEGHNFGDEIHSIKTHTLTRTTNEKWIFIYNKLLLNRIVKCGSTCSWWKESRKKRVHKKGTDFRKITEPDIALKKIQTLPYSIYLNYSVLKDYEKRLIKLIEKKDGKKLDLKSLLLFDIEKIRLSSEMRGRLLSFILRVSAEILEGQYEHEHQNLKRGCFIITKKESFEPYALGRVVLTDIEDFLKSLPFKHMIAICYYFGICGPKKTQTEIAKMLGVSSERIRQMVKRAVEKDISNYIRIHPCLLWGYDSVLQERGEYDFYSGLMGIFCDNFENLSYFLNRFKLNNYLPGDSQG